MIIIFTQNRTYVRLRGRMVQMRLSEFKRIIENISGSNTKYIVENDWCHFSFDNIFVSINPSSIYLKNEKDFVSINMIDDIFYECKNENIAYVKVNSKCSAIEGFSIVKQLN